MEPVVALIGIDWTDEEHAVYLYDVETNTVETGAVKQKPEELHDWVRALRSRYKEGKIAIALEQSRGALIYALMRYDFLLIYPLNPKSLASYRTALRTSGAKDDPTDAELILNFLRTHRDLLRVWVPEDETSRQLTMLVEFRRKIVADVIASTNRLTSLLKTYYPQALEMTGELDTRMACDFLRKWPSIHQLKKAQPAALRKFYAQHNSRATQNTQMSEDASRAANCSAFPRFSSDSNTFCGISVATEYCTRSVCFPTLQMMRCLTVTAVNKVICRFAIIFAKRASCQAMSAQGWRNAFW